MKIRHLLPTLIALAACSAEPSETREITGEMLAASACGSCHLPPDPTDLPKAQWENVLPYMGLRLGIPSSEHDPFSSFKIEETQRILQAGIFPDKPLLEDSLWKKLQSYYIGNAPDSFNIPSRSYPVKEGLFISKFPELSLNGAPFISLTEFDENGELFLGDWQGNLVKLNTSLEIEGYTAFPMPIVDIMEDDGSQMLALSIGELYPNDRLTGAVAGFNGEYVREPRLLFEQLPRPVAFTSGDIDNDGQTDLLICNFGNYVGDLSWYRYTDNGYEQHIVKNAPGATQSILKDLDMDGDLDIIALFAQGDEGVSLFFNEDGSFTEKRVLRFNPLYGNNDMVLDDIDGDGDMDLILSNGDNGDHSITLKPYHGIRIYLNDGSYGFSEAFFQPLFGASKVRVADFDQDGDKDLVAASFFPDSRSGLDQSVLYIENQGNLSFTTYSVQGASEGRWMVMDAGDFDKDGDVDVVIGSFTLAHEGIDPAVMAAWRSGGKFILALENQTIR